MITLPTKTDLDTLMNMTEGPCISLYMPTHFVGSEAQPQDPIRLKKWLKAAEKQLVDEGSRMADAVSLTAPAWELLETSNFWREQGEGLALFIAPNLTQRFHLPYPVKRLLVVNDHFHLKPLFPLLNNDARFYILALSQNKVELLEGSRYDIHPVALRDVPASKAEALREDDTEQKLQRRVQADSPSAPGKRTSVSHGLGGGTQDDDNRTDILRYFQQVDKGLRTTLPRDQTPVVLAGVDYLLPIYREASSYPHLVDTPIEGNPERVRPEELHAEATRILEPYFGEAQKQAQDRYEQFSGNGSGLASNDLMEILQASLAARVNILFVPDQAEQWGRFDALANKIELSDSPGVGDQDLLDLAAMQTYQNGGIVFAVPPDQIPGGGNVAAIFRYSATSKQRQ